MEWLDLEAVLTELDGAVLVFGDDWQVLWESPACARMTGVRIGALTVEDLVRRTHVDDVRSGVQGLRTGEAEVRFWCNDTWRWIRVRRIGPALGGELHVLRDVTELRWEQDHRRTAMELFDAWVELDRDGVLIADSLGLSAQEAVVLRDEVLERADGSLVTVRDRVWRAETRRWVGGMVIALADTAVAMESLRRDALWRRAVESLVDGFWLLDRDGVVLECNSQALGMLALERTEVLGARLADITPGLAAAPDGLSRLRLLSDDGPRVIEARRSACPLGGDDVGVVLVLRDVSREDDLDRALVREREALEVANSELRSVVAALANVRASERNAIARRIHDDPVQRLAALRWRLVGSDDEAAAELERCYDALRAMVSDLRPQAMAERGLRATMEDLEELDERIEVFFDDLTEVGAEVAELVWRNAREAVRNALAHARAQLVVVTLGTEAGWVVCEVHDDGIGVDAGEIHAAERRGHVGVASMRETVQEVGGRFSIGSGEHGGTVVRMEIPLR